MALIWDRRAQVLTDDAPVAYSQARLIDMLPSEHAPVLSLLLDLDDADPLGLQLFAGGTLQAQGGALRDTLFRRAGLGTAASR